tara:strand:+ start:1928 stop:2755 length:828 start_codon:yes stop_codon:yes gene_type:complete
MRHPSELFIKSLLTGGKGDAEINEILLEYGLPCILEAHTEYLSNLRNEVLSNIPKLFTGSNSKDRAFLKHHNIDGLWHPDDVVLAAIRLLANPFLRRDIFIGLLGRVGLLKLAVHLSQKHDKIIKEEDLSAIAHYYYNVEIVSHEEWMRLFEEMPTDAEVFSSCIYGGSIVAAYKLGMERNVTIKEAVKEVVSGLYSQIQEVKEWPASAAKMKIYSDTMSSLARAHSIVNTSDQELAAIAGELKKFKLAKTVEKPVPLTLLTKGNYSNSGKEAAS